MLFFLVHAEKGAPTASTKMMTGAVVSGVRTSVMVLGWALGHHLVGCFVGFSLEIACKCMKTTYSSLIRIMMSHLKDSDEPNNNMECHKGFKRCPTEF